eukprot:6192311-Pleurochrysis_carterae.AAC.3
MSNYMPLLKRALLGKVTTLPDRNGALLCEKTALLCEPRDLHEKLRPPMEWEQAHEGLFGRYVDACKARCSGCKVAALQPPVPCAAHHLQYSLSLRRLPT